MFNLRINPIRKLDFNDVLIVPRKSGLSSRSHVKITKEIKFKHSGASWEGVPIISSNMDTVTNVDTFNVLREKRMLTCFPKLFNEKWLNGTVPHELNDEDNYIISCGIKEQDTNTLFGLFSKLADEGIHPKFLCIDVANGYMVDLITACQKIRRKLPSVTIMAGNVVTPDGVKDLTIGGTVDVVKVGIGSGSVCTTRKITGVGYPQFSAVLECAEKAHELGCHIISDGGISVPGDVSKAFCAGADFVMIGSMLGGHDVSPGDVIEENGKMYKLTYGMSSKVANDKYAGGLGSYKAPEGKVVKVPLKGKLTNTLQRIEGGVRSTCTYIGAEEISIMPKHSNFVLVNKQYNDSLDRLVVDE